MRLLKGWYFLEHTPYFSFGEVLTRKGYAHQKNKKDNWPTHVIKIVKAFFYTEGYPLTFSQVKYHQGDGFLYYGLSFYINFTKRFNGSSSS
jgi:hypothetical protein